MDVVVGGRAMRDVLHAVSASASDEASWAARVVAEISLVLPRAIGLGLQIYEHTEHMQFRALRNYVDSLRITHQRIAPSKRLLATFDRTMLRQLYYPSTPAVMVSTVLARNASDVMDAFQVTEMCGVVAHPGDGIVTVLCCELEHQHTLSAREQHTFAPLMMALTVGFAGVGLNALHTTFSPDGRRLEGDEAPQRIWAAVSSGRYHFVARGSGPYRHVQLSETAPLERITRRLSTHELAVLELSARGVPGKLQAWELGITPSTVSRSLASAAAKLGFETRSDAQRFVSGLLRTSAHAEPLSLTHSERDVLSLVQQGFSNQDIALRRGRSVRTIANQVASLLRKTGAPGRRALYPLLFN